MGSKCAKNEWATWKRSQRKAASLRREIKRKDCETSRWKARARSN
jgi:hypothetical protein